MKKLAFIFLLVIVIVCFVFTTGLTQNNVPQRVIRQTVSGSPLVDPAAGRDYSSICALVNIYDTLVFPNYDGSLSPHLAKNWEVDNDFLRYTFYLRKGVKFHNGDELTAEDVVFSMKRTLAIGEGYAYLFIGVIEDIVAVDKYTVEFILKNPFGPFISTLLRFYISNKNQVLENIASGPYGDMGDYAKQWLTTNDAGSGPYMVKEVIYQDHLYAVRYDDYWGGWDEDAPVAFKMISTVQPVTVRLMLEKQELEITSPAQTIEGFKILDALPGIDIGSWLHGAQHIMMLHNRRAPTDDVNFRKALSYLFDYDNLAKFLWPGSPRAIGPVAFGVPGHNPNLYQYSFNLDKAREYLQKSKYGDKLDQYPIDMLINSDVPDHEKIALGFKAEAEKLGITVNIRKLPWISIVDVVSRIESTPNLVCISVASDYNEAGAMLMSRYHSKSVGTWHQTEWLQDKEIDEMIEGALFTIDRSERFAKYRKIQEILVNDIVPSIWFVDRLKRCAYNSSYVYWPIAEIGKEQGKILSALMGYEFYYKDFKVYPEKKK